MKQVFKYDIDGKFIEPVIIHPVSFLYYTSDDKEFDLEVDAIEYQKQLNPELKIKVLPIYEIPENCTEKELHQPNYKPKFDKELDDWVESASSDEIATLTGNSLEKLKENKIKELNLACNVTILDKFQADIDGIIYYFSHDLEAQNNLNSAKFAFIDNMTTSIAWTAYDIDGNVVRLNLDKSAFDTVYFEHLNHISFNISKFRDLLEPQVESATTIDELNQIVW